MVWMALQEGCLQSLPSSNECACTETSHDIQVIRCLSVIPMALPIQDGMMNSRLSRRPLDTVLFGTFPTVGCTWSGSSVKDSQTSETVATACPAQPTTQDRTPLRIGRIDYCFFCHHHSRCRQASSHDSAWHHVMHTMLQS